MAALTAALLGLTAAGGAMQFAAQRKAGAEARAQGNYEGDVLDLNATLADRNAADALDRGRLAENRQRGDVRGVLGAQRAAYAGSGVDLSSGSVADVQSDTARMGELDALTIRNNAAREAWGYQVEGAQLRSKAKFARQGGKNAQAGYTNQAVSTVLSTGASLISGYRKG